MGGVKWNSENQRTKVAYAISVGPQDPPGDFNRFRATRIGSCTASCSSRSSSSGCSTCWCRIWAPSRTPRPLATLAEWYGLNQYFLYAINPCWNANLRAEWMRDDDGVRIAGPGNIPGVYAWSGRGFAGNFYDVTAGLNWHPNGNLIVRPELRYDWYDGLAGPTGLPFDGGNADDQLTAAVDAIITF